ncbi:hypothetical protein [Streptomyces sp. NPDC059918]
MPVMPGVAGHPAFQSRLGNPLRQLLQQTALARQPDPVGAGPVLTS